MNKKPELDDVERVVRDLVVPFYEIKRSMIVPIGNRRNENDAEHSWSVSFLACALAPQIDSSLDFGKIAQFAIVHDLTEVYAGDVSVWDAKEKLSNKEDKEAQSLNTIASRYPQFPWISKTIKAYETKETKEAKFVYAVDKLIALIMRHLDKGKMYVEKGLTKEKFDAGLVNHRKKAHTDPVIGEYYDQLRLIFDKHPEYFYQEK